MRNGHFITDYHCHSTVSPDGHNTMREMAEAAVRLGVDDLCFTDHIEPLPWDRWNEPPKEKHSYDWAPMLAQFREAQEAVGGRIKLHMGAELGECSFAPDVADSFLDDAPPLDFTIGSVHCYRTASGEVNDLTWITSTDPAGWYAACESYFEEMEKLIDWGRFQVLGHITLPLRWAKELRGVELDFDRYEEQLRHVMRRAIEKGLGIECNTNRGHLPLPDGKWLRLADALYTDIWASMGEEDKIPERVKQLTPYKVTGDVMKATENSDCIFLHCLPSFHDFDTTMAKSQMELGYDIREVTDEVFLSPNSKVFDEAENRMHTIKAVMVATIGNV